MSLDFLSDYTRSVQVKFGNDTESFNLIPDTNLNQIIVLKDKCFGCYSLGDTHRYTPQCSEGISNMTVSTEVDFFYQLHAYETTLNSTQFEEKACLNLDGNFDTCTNLVVLGGERATPRALFLKGNGFLGLGVGETMVGNETKKLSALDQFHERGIIQKKVFGVDTQVHNDTDISSSIRFGDIRTDTLPENHELVYIPTETSDSWAVTLQRLDFHGQDILGAPSRAIISPGFPFIAAPVDEFTKFKDSLKAAHPDTNLVCTRYDWCYFIDECENIHKKVDPMTFYLGSGSQQMNITVPINQVTVPDRDWNTNLTLCHLGIVGQKWHATFDQWVLGEDFMENNYVAFDASDPQRLQIGIASEMAPSTDGGSALKLIAIVTAVALSIVILGLGLWCFCKARRTRRAKEKLEFFQAQHRMAQDGADGSTTDLDGPNAHLNPDGAHDDEDDPSNQELRLGNM